MGDTHTMSSAFRSRRLVTKYLIVLLISSIASIDACGGRRGKCGGGRGGSRRRTSTPPPPSPTIIEQKFIIRGRPETDEQLSSFQNAAEATYGRSLGLWSSQAGRAQSDHTVTSTVAMTWITKRNTTTSVWTSVWGLVWTATATVVYPKAHGALLNAKHLTAEAFTTSMRSMLIAGDLPELHGGGVPNASAIDILPPQARKDEEPGWGDHTVDIIVGIVLLTCLTCCVVAICVHACIALTNS